MSSELGCTWLWEHVYLVVLAIERPLSGLLFVPCLYEESVVDGLDGDFLREVGGDVESQPQFFSVALVPDERTLDGVQMRIVAR